MPIVTKNINYLINIDSKTIYFLYMVNNNGASIAICDISYIFLYCTSTLYTNKNNTLYVGRTHEPRCQA